MTDRVRGWLQFLLFLIIAMLVVLAYSSIASSTSEPGFPLDDAWIHQTYARNLALRGEWSFIPGAPSAGSTSPLWTGLLAIGYRLGANHFAWAWAWGSLLLACVAWLGWRWLLARAPGVQQRAWVAGVLLLGEWHLAWAAASGMEILAQALLGLLTLYAVERHWPIVVQGLLVGLGMWIRPDAAILLVPVVWSVVFSGPRSAGAWARQALGLGAGLALVAVPYLAFNLSLAGEVWPSTFYAKQAEYVSHLAQPVLLRLARQASIGLVGVGAVLTPGIVISVWQDVRGRRWARLAPVIWWMAFLSAYALRLAVTYQHGRYAMPALPVFLVLAAEGLLHFWAPAAHRIRWILSRAWVAASAIVAVAFLALGARAFALDVAVINTEMVATSRWISAHTPAEALIAAHDIGAVGYFGERRLIDLAGLVTPQVLPILRDEPGLEAYLEAQGADFLMTFPGWYPSLVDGRTPVYRSTAPFSPRMGGESMAVYEW